MSDFLGRLAARHADSAPAVITPRAVSRFEAAPVTVKHDVVEPSPIPATRPLAARLPETLAAVAPRSLPPQQLAAPQASRTEKEEIRQADRAAPMRTRVEQILNEVETIRTAQTTPERRREIVREQRIVASPVIPRIEKAPETRQAVLGRASTRHAAPEESEPPVVRVHIGRIDVRVAAPTTDRQPPRIKAADAAKPMSLDRYLSSKDRP